MTRDEAILEIVRQDPLGAAKCLLQITEDALTTDRRGDLFLQETYRQLCAILANPRADWTGDSPPRRRYRLHGGRRRSDNHPPMSGES